MSAKPMTREEALVEARRRWGPHAVVHGEILAPDGTGFGNWCAVDDREYACFVGCNHIDGIGEECTVHRGWGDSWEAAFADADRREKGGE